MIDPKELRIGNCIQLYRRPKDSEMTIHQIKSVYFDDEEKKHFCELEDGFKVNIDTGICEIIITEELLLKAGFKKQRSLSDSSGEYYDFEDVNVRFEDDKLECFNIWDEMFGGIIVDEISSFHHLQNIVFDLTGKELTLWKK